MPNGRNESHKKYKFIMKKLIVREICICSIGQGLYSSEIELFTLMAEIDENKPRKSRLMKNVSGELMTNTGD